MKTVLTILIVFVLSNVAVLFCTLLFWSPDPLPATIGGILLEALVAVGAGIVLALLSRHFLRRRLDIIHAGDAEWLEIIPIISNVLFIQLCTAATFWTYIYYRAMQLD